MPRKTKRTDAALTEDVTLRATIEPMAGAEDAEEAAHDPFRCSFKFNQEVCVDAKVTIVPRARCRKGPVICLEGGFGRCPEAPSNCTFHVFQKLCVEAELELDVDFDCVPNQARCVGDPKPGPCRTC